MRRANTAVKCERYPIPTVQETIQDLNGCTVFSKIDLRMGYHQVELTEESRDITTFITDEGLFRFKRLMFGISSVSEMFQHIIRQLLESCDGVHNISDDIIVAGRDREEHDQRLEAALKKLEEHGLTINADKSQFRLSHLKYMGHKLSSDGLEVDDSKIRAVIDCTAPTSVAEVRSFLGLAQYCAKFLPDFSSISDPLWELTRGEQAFTWNRDQQKAFDSIKSMMTRTPVLAYHRLGAHTRLTTDASPVGLGAVLEQKQLDGSYKPVWFASRCLSPTERRYSQFEKEALGVMWGVEHFRLYLLGTQFEIRTDNKPLVSAYGPTGNPPARVMRFALSLQPYNYTIKHISGTSNIADFLSHAPVNEPEDLCYFLTEEYIRSAVLGAVPPALTAQEVEKISGEDPEMMKIRRALVSDDWTQVDAAYRNVRYELSASGQIVMRGCRIVIPREQRAHVLNLAHEGHPGIVKTKSRIRESAWWPGMDNDVERVVKGCHTCQLVGRKPVPEPLIPTELPSGPWQEVAVDLMDAGDGSDHLLVLIDYYSRWSEVAVMKSTKAHLVIRCIEKMIITHGVPVTLRSDNGQPFDSEEFSEFCREYGITQIKGIPYWPPSNGEVESHNQTLLKALRIAKIEKSDYKLEIERLLFAYRTTPQSTTGVSPAELMFGHKLRSKLPSVRDVPMQDDLPVSTPVGTMARVNDALHKAQSKEYRDRKVRARDLDVTPGDRVLLKNQRKLSKLTSTFEDSPYEVLQKKGSAVILKGEDGSVKMRNAAHLKRYETIPEHLLYQPEMNTVNNDRGMPEQAEIGGLNNPSVIETQLEKAAHPPDPGPPSPRPNPHPPDPHQDVLPPDPRTTDSRPERIKKIPFHLSDYEMC